MGPCYAKSTSFGDNIVMKYYFTLVLIGSFFSVLPLSAQKRELKPWDLSTYTCETHQKILKDTPRLAQALNFWAHGYVSGLQKADVKAEPIGRDAIKSLTKKIESACGSDGKKLFFDALKEIK